MKHQTRRLCGSTFCKLRMTMFLAGLLITVGIAQAFELESGNPDVVMRFDNTLRYNAAWRVAGRDPALGNNPAFDEGEYLYDKGDMITNRVDLFSEFDYNYQKRMGFRVSGALWYDERYSAKDKSNPLLPGSNYPGNQFTPYVKRFYHGPSGEFLDTFAWSIFKLGETTLSVKAGRHGLLWGEAIFGIASANSVAVDMAPSDGSKGVMSPGATAKELTLPINQLTGTWQLNDRLSFSGQYTFEWRPSRVPEGGTYFGPADAILFGPPLVSGAGNGVGGVGPQISRVDTIKGDKGDWGLSARWRPEWLNEGSLGFYYRRYDVKSPTWGANTFLSPGPAAVAVYAKDVSLWGISFGGTIGGNAIGAEISRRHNTPLNVSGITSAALGFEGPKGDTWHALVNTTTLINKTDYFDNASLVFELTYQKLDKITSNKNLFKSSATTPAACTLDEIVKGCSTNSAWHLAALFSSVWLQVMPSTDLTGSIVLQTGLKGNAPTTGINEGATVFNMGLQVDYAMVNRFALSYTNFMGKRKYMGNSGAAGPYQATNGAPAIYADRDFVSFTYSRSF